VSWYIYDYDEVLWTVLGLSGPSIYIHGGRSLTFELKEVEKEGEEEVEKEKEGEVAVEKEGEEGVVSEGKKDGDVRGWGR
jgi:hypothetical protein